MPAARLVASRALSCSQCTAAQIRRSRRCHGARSCARAGRALLLLPTNMAKGLAEGFINDFVNGDLIDSVLNRAAVG